MSSKSTTKQVSGTTTEKGKTYSGVILEVGPPTTSFSGSKISYLRLRESNGNEVNIPGVVVLGALAPYIRQGEDVTVYIERCCFNDVMFGVRTAKEEVVSDDLGPVKIFQYYSYMLMGVGVLTLCIVVGLIFLGVGAFVYQNTKPPKPDVVLKALRKKNPPKTAVNPGISQNQKSGPSQQANPTQQSNQVQVAPKTVTAATTSGVPSWLSNPSTTLVGRSTEVAGQRFEIQAPLVIGTNNPAFSMVGGLGDEEAMITQTANGISVTDRLNRGNVSLNNQPCAQATLSPGDTLRVGTLTFTVE